MLYDEPTTGLDPDRLRQHRPADHAGRDRIKVTSVVVTHDMRSARRVGQRILFLHQQRIYLSDTPENFFRSADPVVYQFVNGISNPKEHTF